MHFGDQIGDQISLDHLEAPARERQPFLLGYAANR
jgi:hypothetical protein